MLINQKKIKQYIKELNPEISQIGGDVLLVLNEQVRTLIQIAVKRNGTHTRITDGEFQILDPFNMDRR
jgi:hypothetical protein